MPTPDHQKIACLFPGQGAQYPGIGKDLYDQFAVVRDTYHEAGDALGYDIADLSFNGPADKINLTRHTQPILLTHAIACRRAFNEYIKHLGGHSIRVSMAAGHSLGEYCALVCADALSFAGALQLVKKRGELMGEYGHGEMEALMLDFESARELAGRHHCEIAACNLPEQNVVGGMAEDLDALIRAMASRFPKKRSARLKTEGAFHTFHMVEAAMRFRETLAQAAFTEPRFPVLSNFTGAFHEHGQDADLNALKSRLFLQLFNPVLWHQNLMRVGADADLLIEFGGGLGKGEGPAAKRPNLEGMVKKAWPEADQRPAYLSVINTRTLEDSARALT